VDGLRQVLSAELPLLALGEPLEDLEVAHAQPVPLAELALERRGRVPALGLITGVAAIGAAVALGGLRRRPDLEAKSAGDLDVADLPAGAPVLQEAGLANDSTAVSG